MPLFRLRLAKGIAQQFEGKRYRRGTIYTTNDPDRYLAMMRSGFFIEAEPRQQAPSAKPAEPGASMTIIRSRGLGDVLMALPAVQEFAKRNPWSEISYAVPDDLVKLIGAQPHIRAIPISGKLEARRIDLSDSPERSGKESSWTRQALFARALGLPLDDAKAAALRAKLRVEDCWMRWEFARPICAIAPLASVLDRTIDPDTVDDLSIALSGRGWTVIGIGCHPIAGEIPGPMTAEELAGLIAISDLVIAADSGPLHLAGHLEIPCIGLFTNWPAWTRMRGYRGIGLEPEWLECNPCFGRACAPRWCTSSFPADEILISASKLLPPGMLASPGLDGPFLSRAQEFHPIGK